MWPLISGAAGSRLHGIARAQAMVYSHWRLQTADRFLDEIEATMNRQAHTGMSVQTALFRAQGLHGVVDSLKADFLSPEYGPHHSPDKSPLQLHDQTT
jgi:hypothetical protein